MITHPTPLNPLTDRHRSENLPSCERLSKSHKGFRFRACATSRTTVYSAILGVFLSPTVKTPWTLTQNAPKRRGSEQGRIFSGPQKQNLIFTPLSPKKTLSRGLISTALRNFRPQTALTLVVH